MKFSLFVHMERFDRSGSNRVLLEELTELALMAEEGGFETVWIGEHHGMQFTIAPNPFIYLTYIGQRTARIRLGTGTVVAPFWHPIKLAGEAAITDLMIDGRLELGLARGAYQFEFDRLGGGMPGAEGGKYLREMVPAIKGLWAGNYAHEGECWSFPSTTCVPTPEKGLDSRIWIAARDPDSHDFAVANGCNVMVTPLWLGDDEVSSLVKRFEAAMAKNPTVSRPKLLLLRHTYVAGTEEEAVAASWAMSRYYCYFGAWFKNDRPIQDGFIEDLSDEEMAARQMYAPALMRENLVIGTPETVIDRLRAYESSGFDEYSFWIDSGMKHTEKRASLKRFITEVAPAFA